MPFFFLCELVGQSLNHPVTHQDNSFIGGNLSSPYAASSDIILQQLLGNFVGMGMTTGGNPAVSLIEQLGTQEDLKLNTANVDYSRTITQNPETEGGLDPGASNKIILQNKKQEKMTKYTENNTNRASPMKKKQYITTEKRFKCSICSRGFKKRSNMVAHQQTHLPESKRIRHRCNICSNSYLHKKDLKRHRKLAHPRQECSSCVERSDGDDLFIRDLFISEHTQST